MINYSPIIQKLNSIFFFERSVDVDVLRLDLIDKEISGNKWFKLKKNLEEVKSKKIKTVITFGGAFSNHIAATAAACKMAGLNSIGVIRGEKSDKPNETLANAKVNGMHLHYVSRENYNQKNTEVFKRNLTDIFGEHYLIPEGGNNKEGILGCSEILIPDWNYDFIFCACGTAATYSGILSSCKPNQKLIGINVLKGENTLIDNVNLSMRQIFPQQKFIVIGNEGLEKNGIDTHCITNNYCFSGYAKLDKELIDFKNKFEKEYNIPLDYVYTSKLFYAVFDLVLNNKILPNTKILIIHCGGLQGNKGFEKRYKLN
jgi:1-aminocyclopropane-1-carboxylate deaminase